MGWWSCGFAAVIVLALLHATTGQTTTVTQVRLRGGPNSTSGRVEVQIGGVFGTVCDDLWDNKDATVVCKQLGLTGGVALGNAFFGAGTGPILMDDVDCKGDEKNLSRCYFSTVHNCAHSEDASVVCQPAGAAATASPLPTTTRAGVTQPDNCEPGVNPQATVRLFGPATLSGVGYVQVRGPNNVYGYVCDDGWDVNAAKVVCKELCYQQSLAESTMRKDFQVGVANPTFALDDVVCVGTESRLADCQHRPWFQHDCDATELAAVTCVTVEYPTPTQNGSEANGTTPEPVPPSTQDTAPSPNLQCRNGDLIALFNKSRDPNLEPKHLSLLSPCTELNKDGTDPNYITVTIPFDKCGTNVTQNETHIIYTNTIIIEPTSREGAISRANTYNIQLICEMPRNATVDREVQPVTETVIQRAEGEFNITMNIYRDRRFQQRATVYPFQLTLGEWLNAAVELEAIDSRLKLVVTDCIASPNISDPSAPSINLLQDKCAAERATLEMHPLSKVKMGMRLQSFSFVNYPLVVIQCDTIVCLTSEITSECDRSCNNSKPAPSPGGSGNRRRRDVIGSDEGGRGSRRWSDVSGSGSRYGRWGNVAWVDGGIRRRRDVSESGASTDPKPVYTVRSLPVVVVVVPLTGPTEPSNLTFPFSFGNTTSTTPTTSSTTSSTASSTTTTSTTTTTTKPIVTSTPKPSSSTTTTAATTKSTAKTSTTVEPTSTKNVSTKKTREPSPSTSSTRESTAEGVSSTTTTTTTTTPVPTTTVTPILITVRGTGRPLTTTQSGTSTPLPAIGSTMSRDGIVVREGGESCAPCRMRAAASTMLVFLVLAVSICCCRGVPFVSF